MINSVVLDLDGTLLNDEMEISDVNRRALQSLDALGIPYFIATGRPEQLAKPVVSTLGYNRPMIMYNGSVIGHPFWDDRLFSEAINPANIDDIVSFCDERGMIVMLYTKDAIYSDPNYRVDFFEKRNEALPEKDRAVFKTMDAFDPMLEVNKILIIEHDSAKREAFKTHFENTPSLRSALRIVQSQPSFMDINPKGTSKGRAIDILYDELGLDTETCMALGDQDNDVSMKGHAGMFVAMGNASHSVKAVADHVTGGNAENGVAAAIEKFIINK